MKKMLSVVLFSTIILLLLGCPPTTGGGGATGSNGGNTGNNGGSETPGGGTDEPVIIHKIEYYVSETGSDEADGKTAATAFASVQKAVNMAISDTAENQEKYTYVITVEGEITTSSSPESGSASYGFVVIDSSKTLNFLIEAPEGQRATLKSDGSKRLFYIEGLNTAVTLRRLDIVDGVDYSGGGISLEAGMLTLDDVHLDNNESTGYPGGGGLDVADGNNIIIKNSKFTSNVADDDGGAISIGENVNCTIDNSTFGGDNETLANSSKEGSAVYAYKANKLSISNSVFKNNIAANEGMIYCYNPKTLIFNDISVSQTISSGVETGSGVYLRSYDEDNPVSIAFTDVGISGFQTNNGAGGGLFIDNAHGTITGGTIQNNIAINSDQHLRDPINGNGGGAFIKNSTITITGTTFSANRATNTSTNQENVGVGGGLALDESEIVMENCIVSGNYSNGKDYELTSIATGFPETKYGASGGGGVFVDENSTLTITGGTFSQNISEYAGGALNVIGTCIINGTVFGGSEGNGNATVSGNGGAIHVFNVATEKGDVTINDATISYNEAVKVSYSTGNGGGIYSDGSLSLNNAMISSNKAVNGAGLYSINSFVDNGSSISKNISTENGGGAYFGEIQHGSSSQKFSSTTFSENEATSGGGIYVNEEGVTFSGVTISKNKASNGAGVFIDVDRNEKIVIESNSTITKNIATENGGGILLSGSSGLNINNTTLSENQAVMGGGICAPDHSNFNTYPSLTADRIQVLSNSASDSGGGVFYRDEGTLILSNSTVSRNTAINDGGGIYHFSENDEFTLSDGIIISHNSAKRGGGIFGGANLEGGTIEENSASTFGGGMFLGSSGGTSVFVYINGGEIRNNYSPFGGAVYVYTSFAKLYLSGSPVIWENYTENDKITRNNISFEKAQASWETYPEVPLRENGIFEVEAKIGITPSWPIEATQHLIRDFDESTAADWDNVLAHIIPDDSTVYYFEKSTVDFEDGIIAVLD